MLWACIVSLSGILPFGFQTHLPCSLWYLSSETALGTLLVCSLSALGTTFLLHWLLFPCWPTVFDTVGWTRGWETWAMECPLYYWLTFLNSYTKIQGFFFSFLWIGFHEIDFSGNYLFNLTFKICWHKVVNDPTIIFPKFIELNVISFSWTHSAYFYLICFSEASYLERNV